MEFDVVAWVSKFTVLQERVVADWWGRCPLPTHDDKTPSFHIDGSTGTFYCFGCGFGGYLPRLVAALRHVSYGEAYAYLRGRGWVPPEDSQPQQLTPEKVRLQGLVREQQYWSQQVRGAVGKMHTLSQDPETFDWGVYADSCAQMQRAELVLEELDAKMFEAEHSVEDESS